MINKGEPPINCSKEQWNAIKVWCNECVEQAKAEERKKCIKKAGWLIKQAKAEERIELTKRLYDFLDLHKALEHDEHICPKDIMEFIEMERETENAKH